MLKSGVDQEALIQMFSDATVKQGDQLRKAVFEATLGALQGRELTLQNIRSVLKTVTQASSTGVARNPAPALDIEAMLGGAIQGMDDALLQAVQANRVALQQFVAQGADLQDKHLKKALGDLEKLEDLLIGTVGKAVESAGAQLAAQWSPVLEKVKLSGTHTGAQAALAVEQLGEQMRNAMREGRASGLRAAQALAQSYAALVSGVLIGLSDAMQHGNSRSDGTAPGSRRK